MGESELAAQLAAALAEKEEALRLAVDVSVQRDEAVSLLTVATAAAVGPKPGLQPPAAPAPPPAPPPPPRPASVAALYALPPSERERVREAYGGGDKLEEELDAEFHRNLATRNARHSSAPGFNVTAPGGGGHLPESPYRSADYDPPSVIAENHRKKMSADFERAKATFAALPDGSPLKAQQASLMAGIGTGRPAARPAAAPAPAPPKGAAPVGAKTRTLPRFSR